MANETALAELAAFVEKCTFPCSKQDLLDEAEEQGALDEVVDIIEKLPEQEYLSETWVVEAAEGVR